MRALSEELLAPFDTLSIAVTDPIGNDPIAMAWLAFWSVTGAAVHAKVSGSPFGSWEALPSSCVVVAPFAAHSRILSPPALATGQSAPVHVASWPGGRGSSSPFGSSSHTSGTPSPSLSPVLSAESGTPLLLQSPLLAERKARVGGDVARNAHVVHPSADERVRWNDRNPVAWHRTGLEGQRDLGSVGPDQRAGDRNARLERMIVEGLRDDGGALVS